MVEVACTQPVSPGDALQWRHLSCTMRSDGAQGWVDPPACTKKVPAAPGQLHNVRDRLDQLTSSSEHTACRRAQHAQPVADNLHACSVSSKLQAVPFRIGTATAAESKRSVFLLSQRLTEGWPPPDTVNSSQPLCCSPAAGPSQAASHQVQDPPTSCIDPSVRYGNVADELHGLGARQGVQRFAASETAPATLLRGLVSDRPGRGLSPAAGCTLRTPYPRHCAHKLSPRVAPLQQWQVPWK